MQKDFDSWNTIKKDTEKELREFFFKPREIWWCRLGCNIGHEQDGKGVEFERPVVIIKKFNNRICLTAPLTTKLKDNKYYVPIVAEDGVDRMCIISQIRLTDIVRFNEKIGFATEETFNQIIKAIKDML